MDLREKDFENQGKGGNTGKAIFSFLFHILYPSTKDRLAQSRSSLNNGTLQ